MTHAPHDPDRLAKTRRWRAALGASIAACIGVPSGFAQPTPPPRGITLIASAEGLATVRRRPVADTTLDLLRETGLVTPEDDAAWSRLAGSLGLSASATFDALAGRRITIAIGKPDAASTSPRWTALLDVDQATAKHVIDTLKPAPRGLEGGMPRWSLEGGALDLTKIGEHPGGILVALAPAGVSLFREHTDAARWLLAPAPGETRVSAMIPGSVPGESHRAECTIVPRTNGWSATISADAGLFGVTPGTRPPGVAGSPPPPGAPPRPLFSIEAWSASPRAAADSPISLYYAAFSMMGVRMPEWSNLGPRFVLTLDDISSPARAAGPATPSSVTLTIAVETRDLARAARQGDAMLDSLLSLPARVNALTSFITKLPDTALTILRGERPRPPEFRRAPKGLPGDPDALRLAFLNPAAPGDAPATVLAWTYLAHPDGSPGGWWLIHMRTGSDADAQAAIDLASRELTQRENRFPLLRVRARPAPLHDLITRDSPPLPPGWLRAMRLVETADLDVWLDERGHAVGTADIRLRSSAR
ncbi:MAG: hypothetical protein HRU70_00945 [Phycisphaeraceae bacterium]|nr:MAG: hypothetical protein HRU70_00945 [Phycisphaeraceae bacterium]